jgi:hypothetical protein
LVLENALFLFPEEPSYLVVRCLTRPHGVHGLRVRRATSEDIELITALFLHGSFIYLLKVNTLSKTVCS